MDSFLSSDTIKSLIGRDDGSYEIPALIQKLLEKCVNRTEAERLLRAVVACGKKAPNASVHLLHDHVPEWCPPEEAFMEDGWTPPQLEARFSFFETHNGLYGAAYSVIAGTDVFVDINKAARCEPGYVTPALLAGPSTPDNPYGGWTFARLSEIPWDVFHARRRVSIRRTHLPRFAPLENVPAQQLVAEAAAAAISRCPDHVWSKVAGACSWTQVTIMDVLPTRNNFTYDQLVRPFPDEPTLDELYGNDPVSSNI